MAKNPVVTRNHAVLFAGLQPALDGLRIAHISDLHLRRWNHVLEHTRQLLRSLHYDVLAVTGDFCVEPWLWPSAAELCHRLFEQVRPRLGIFGVLGNHDAPELSEQSELGITFMRNECLALDFQGVSLPIAGLDPYHENDQGILRLLDAIPAHRPSLLLAHFPSTIKRLPPNRIGLVLSGHTHGGQIRLPGLGCLWPHDAIPRKMGWGLHRVNGTALHVSAGIGVSGPLNWRFCCPPEVTVLTLRASNKSSTLDDWDEQSRLKPGKKLICQEV